MASRSQVMSPIILTSASREASGEALCCDDCAPRSSGKLRSCSVVDVACVDLARQSATQPAGVHQYGSALSSLPAASFAWFGAAIVRTRKLVDIARKCSLLGTDVSLPDIHQHPLPHRVEGLSLAFWDKRSFAMRRLLPLLLSLEASQYLSFAISYG